MARRQRRVRDRARRRSELSCATSEDVGKAVMNLLSRKAQARHEKNYFGFDGVAAGSCKWSDD